MCRRGTLSSALGYGCDYHMHRHGVAMWQSVASVHVVCGLTVTRWRTYGLLPPGLHGCLRTRERPAAGQGTLLSPPNRLFAPLQVSSNEMHSLLDYNPISFSLHDFGLWRPFIAHCLVLQCIYFFRFWLAAQYKPRYTFLPSVLSGSAKRHSVVTKFWEMKEGKHGSVSGSKVCWTYYSF